MAIRYYRELIVWQKAMELSRATYRLTGDFPNSEKFGLCLQMRRCAVSVPSNIAEGQGRGTANEFIRFLRIANGSRQELETQALLAGDLDFVKEDEVASLLMISEEVGRLISGLIRSLETPFSTGN